MTKIWLIRHGESAANAGGRTTTVDGIVLTDRGHEQAAHVATLFTQAPDLIVTSPYIRTHLTAAPTCARFPDAPRETWPIQEFTYLNTKKYQNTTVDERRPHALAYWEKGDIDAHDGDGAESFRMFFNRVKDLTTRLAASDKKFIAVFGHGIFMHMLEIVLKEPELRVEQAMERLREARKNPMPNTHIFYTEKQNGKIVFTDVATAAPNKPNKPPSFNP